MKNEDFYRAFCTQLALREVPTGFVLKTPFRRPDGDAVALYLRRMDGGGFRIEDDGELLVILLFHCFDFPSEIAIRVH